METKATNITQKMWAYLCFDRNKFFHVFDSEEKVRMCSPDGFKTNEQEGYGKVIMVTVGNND